MKVKSALLLLLCACPSSALLSQTTICGYSVNADDSTAIEGTTIFLNDQYNLPLPEDLRTTTDSTGYYEFRNIEPGKYSVNAWTYFNFHADTFAYIVQPGIFDIDPSSAAFKSPCFFVNFLFKLHVSDSLYEERIVVHKNMVEHRREQLISTNDTLDFPLPDWMQIDWPKTVLPDLIRFHTETIEELFIPSYSAYIRRKDW